MSQARIQLTNPAVGYLDIKDGTSFPLNFSVGDIRDISKRNGSYSRTITLVGNANNNRLLGYLFDINMTNRSFNINTLQECIVEENGRVILDNMYLQLISINKIQVTGSHDEFIEYECEIKDSATDFFTKIQNKELTDLDISAFNHIYTVGTATQSFDNTWVDGYKYVLPYLDGTDYIIQDLKPGVYNRIYWDKIFDNAGYTYTFDEQDNLDIRFNQLIIPYNGDKPKPIENTTNWVEAVTTDVPKTRTTSSQQNATAITYNTIFDVEITDNLGYYNPVTGEYTLAFNVAPPDRIQYDFRINYSIEFINLQSFTVSLQGSGNGQTIYSEHRVKNETDNLTQPPAFGGGFSLPSGFTLGPGDNVVLCSNFDESISVNATNLSVGDVLKTYFTLKRLDNDGNTTHQTWRNSSGVEFGVQLKVVVNSYSVIIKPALDTFVEGSTLTMNSFIPKKIKQSDYIKSICQMFNLYIDIDKDNITNLIIKTRDRFYDEGVIVDWTDKLVKNNTQVLRFLPDLGNKKMILTYKDDKDTLNSNYKNIINETYGQLEYTFENEYVRDIKRQELLFSPTPMLYTNFGANLPGIVGQAPNTNIRILLDNGVKDCFQYTINSTQSSVATLDYYPFISHFNDAENPTFDINYGICDYYFYNPDSLSGVEFNNLTYLHWIRTLNQINNGKLLSANFNLNSNDIAKLKLNDKIRIDNSYWNINKVIDYDANSNNLTKVELISIDDALELGTFRSQPTYVPTDSDIEFTDKGDIKNGIGKSRNFYTNIDSSNGKMKGNGIQNQFSNLSRGYTDGNRNVILGAGYSEVKGTGNTLSSAAMVYANNNIVDEDLVNVFSFKDDYHATQSNIFVIPNDLWIVGPTPSINGIPWPSGVQEDLEETLRLGNTTGTYSIILTDGVSISGGVEPISASATNILNLGDTLTNNGSWYLGDRDLSKSAIFYDDSTQETALMSFIGPVALYSVDQVAITGVNNIFLTSDLINTNSNLSTSITTLAGNINLNNNGGEVTILNVATASMDANVLFREPTGEVRILGLTAGIINSLSGGWPGVLSINNTSGGNNAVMTTGDVITSDVATINEINMNYGFSNGLLISNDNSGYGSGVLYMENGFLNNYVELSHYNGAVYSNSTLETLITNNNNQLNLTDSATTLWRNTGVNDQNRLYFSNGFGFSNADLYSIGTSSQIRIGISANPNEIFIKDNASGSVTNGSVDAKAVFIGSNNSIIGTSSVNSVVIGGNDVTINSSGCIASGDTVTITDTNSFNSIILGAATAEITNSSPYSAIIGGELSRINSATRTVILGGNNIADATYDNTVYQQDSYRDGGNHIVQTSNTTITDLYSFTPDSNGVWIIDTNVTGFASSNGNAIGVKAFAVFKVIAGVVTQVSTTTIDRKSNFLPVTTVTVDTDGTNIRVRVTGALATVVDWRGSITITK